MSRLIESIRLFNGQFSRLDLHQSRIDHSFAQVFRKFPEWRLQYFLVSQDFPKEGLYKCRVMYDDKQVHVEFNSYQPRPIQTLKLIADNEIEYPHKWEDRSRLQEAFAQRESCDDILIVKNGLLMDTCYANIVFQKE